MTTSLSFRRAGYLSADIDAGLRRFFSVINSSIFDHDQLMAYELLPPIPSSPLLAATIVAFTVTFPFPTYT